jgi:hypothetical protein
MRRATALRTAGMFNDYMTWACLLGAGIGILIILFSAFVYEHIRNPNILWVGLIGVVCVEICATKTIIDRLQAPLPADPTQPTTQPTTQTTRPAISRDNPGRTFEVMQGRFAGRAVGSRFTEYDFRMQFPRPTIPGATSSLSLDDHYEEVLHLPQSSGQIRVVPPGQGEPAVTNTPTPPTIPVGLSQYNQGRLFEVVGPRVLGPWRQGDVFSEYEFRLQFSPPPDPQGDPAVAANDWYEGRFVQLLRAGTIRDSSPPPPPAAKVPIGRSNQGRTFKVVCQQLGAWHKGAIFTEYEFRKAHQSPVPSHITVDDYFEDFLADHLTNGKIVVVA